MSSTSGVSPGGSARAGRSGAGEAVVGLCTDEAVNGAPFYVMDFVDGLVIRDAAVAATLTLEQRAAAGRSIAATLAKIHAVDPDAVGLGAAWSAVNDFATRPPRAAGVKVADDGDGGAKIADYLASQKLV